MADNTTIAAMAGGDTIATDDIGGGVKVQRVKVGHGADGSYSDASATTPLPVTVSTSASVGATKATVTTAGTRVQLGTNTALSVTVRAKLTNAGIIYLGGSNVSSSNGFDMSPGDTISLDVGNTNQVWIDAATSGDAVSYAWVAA